MTSLVDTMTHTRMGRIISGSVLTGGFTLLALAILFSAERPVDASTSRRSTDSSSSDFQTISGRPALLPDAADDARSIAPSRGVNHAIYEATGDEMARPQILLMHQRRAAERSSDASPLVADPFASDQFTDVIWLTGQVRPIAAPTTLR